MIRRINVLYVAGVMLILLIVLSSARLVRAQRDVRQAPAFAVVSVKVDKSETPGEGFFRPAPGGRLTGTNVTLRRLIQEAYSSGWPRAGDVVHLRVPQIVGGPSWMVSEHFTIDARADGNPGPVEYAAMLRELLADRFRLVARHEKREHPVYALVVARGDGKLGPQLHAGVDCQARLRTRGLGMPLGGAAVETRDERRRGAMPAALDAQDCGAAFAPGVIRARGVSMRTFVSVGLGSVVDRPVIDRTSLTGGFDIDLEFSPDAFATPTGPDDRQSIFAAIQTQLGLKLDPQRAPVDVLIIERADRPAAD